MRREDMLTEAQAKARAVKGMDIKKVVDDPEWQSIRKSLIGNWINNHKHNVKTLRAYFNKHKDSPLAVRRVLNVLTGSVHRTGKTEGQKETNELRKDVRVHWRNMLGEPYDKDDYRYKTGAI
jgi:hypothetical protein